MLPPKCWSFSSITDRSEGRLAKLLERPAMDSMTSCASVASDDGESHGWIGIDILHAYSFKFSENRLVTCHTFVVPTLILNGNHWTDDQDHHSQVSDVGSQ